MNDSRIVLPLAALVLLAGCTASAPPNYGYGTPALPGSAINMPGPYTNRGFYAPRQFVPVPPPLTYSFAPPAETRRSINPAMPEFHETPAPAPLRPVDPPDDALELDHSCGWWRLCNLWSGSF